MPEEQEVLTAEELAAQQLETPPKDPTPKGGEVPPEPEYDFEFDPGDGSGARRLTAKDMADRLSNYEKLQTKLGESERVRGEAEKKLAELQAKLEAKPAPENKDDWDEENELKKKIADLEKKIETMPSEFDTKVSEKAQKIAMEMSTEQEISHIASSHERIKKIDDPEIQRDVIMKAAAFGMRENKRLGRIVYPTTESAIDAYFLMLQGETPKIGQAAFVRNLKSPEDKTLSASGGKPAGDVVKRYAQLTDQKQRVEFMSSLKDEERDVVLNAIYAGEIE